MTVHTPLISVILPSYNYARYLRAALDSIVSQTYTHWELIAVDDGSKDASLSILQEYAAQYPENMRVLTHPHHENRGLKESYKLAFEHANGDIVTFLEADDLWYPDSIRLRVDVLAHHPDVAVVYSGIEIFGYWDWHHPFRSLFRYAGVQWYLLRIALSVPKHVPFSANALRLNRIPIPTFSCAMVRKSALQQLDFAMPKDTGAWFDKWLWAQVSMKGKFYYLAIPLTRWRRHLGSYEATFLHSWFKKKRHAKAFHAYVLQRQREGFRH
jgi:glycosyltransferase involved in cell wall biosynthesis